MRTPTKRRVVVVLLLLNVLVASLLVALRVRDVSQRPRNVIIFSLCSLRADRVGCLGSLGLTPNIDRLAARGVLFEHAYAQASNTGPSHQAVFTGRYPVGTTETNAGILPGEVAMAECMRAGGLQTAAFHDNPSLARDFAFNRGFDVFDHPTPPSCSNSIRAALRWLDKDRDLNRPFFLFVQGTDIHPPGPFVARPCSATTDENLKLAHYLLSPGRNADIEKGAAWVPKFARQTTERISAAEVRAHPDAYQHVTIPESTREHMRFHYDEAVREVDKMFGAFLDGLDERGLARDTLIVLMGDHGWELFERGNFTHGRHGYEGIAHVPLIMAGPGVPAGRRIDDDIELMSLAPTLLESLGLPPCSRHQALSLSPLIQGVPEDTPRYAVSGVRYKSIRGHLRSRHHELVWLTDGTFELYDLRTDPLETHNLINEPASEEDLAQLYAMLTQLLPLLQSDGSAAPLSFPKPSLKTRDQLRARGYW